MFFYVKIILATHFYHHATVDLLLKGVYNYRIANNGEDDG